MLLQSTGDTGTSSTVDPASTTDVDDGLSVTVSNVIDSNHWRWCRYFYIGKESSTNPDNSTITFYISDTTNYKIDSSTGDYINRGWSRFSKFWSRFT